MQISLSHSQSLDRTFTVVISEEERQASLEEHLVKIAQKIKMPGFRPGKVPINMIRDQITGEATEKSIHALISKACDQVIKEHSLTLAERPEVDFVSEDLTAGPIEFKLNLQIKPTVVLPDYSAISIEKLEIEPGDEYYEKMIAKDLDAQYLVPIDQPIPSQTPFYFKGTITVFVNNKKKKDRSYDQEIIGFVDASDKLNEHAYPFFYPFIADKLFGKKAGDVVTCEDKPTDEKFLEKHPELSGKTLRFEIHIKEVLEERQVSLEEFFTVVYPELQTKDNLKAEIKKALNQTHAQPASLYSKKLLLDALFDQCVFDVSEKKVESEFEAIWKQLQQELEKAKAAGDEDPADGKTEDEMREEYQKIALRRVRLGHLITEISARERVGVSQEEFRMAVMQQAFKNPQYFQQIIAYYRDNAEASRQLVASITEDKVVELILSRVARPAITLTQEEFQEKIESVLPGYFDEDSDEEVDTIEQEADDIAVDVVEPTTDLADATEEAPVKKAGRKKKGE